MTQKDPTRRPTSEEALKLFEGLVEGVPPYKLQWRLQEHNASRMSVLLRDVGSVKDICFTAIRSILCTSQLACVSQELTCQQQLNETQIHNLCLLSPELIPYAPSSLSSPFPL